MTTVHVLRVFVGNGQRYGSSLGVFLDGPAVPARERQSVAAELGYNETVFVDDIDRAVVRIFSPVCELPFAGHPLVGTAWLLSRLARPPTVLRPPAGDVLTWREGSAVWIRGRAIWAPDWEQIQLNSADLVDRLRGPWEGHDFVQFWAWQEEPAGVVRARVFAPRVGVDEDEACGSATMLLAHRLNRTLLVRHGDGSLIHVRSGSDGTVDVGGDVAADGTREFGTAGR